MVSTGGLEAMGEPLGVTHHEPNVNGIRYHYAEAGEGPLILLLHGFPELWYSWRHQITALAGAGYRAVAPDLRGFGRSEVTTRVEDYGLLRHAEDVKASKSPKGSAHSTLRALGPTGATRRGQRRDHLVLERRDWTTRSTEETK